MQSLRRYAPALIVALTLLVLAIVAPSRGSSRVTLGTAAGADQGAPVAPAGVSAPVGGVAPSSAVLPRPSAGGRASGTPGSAVTGTATGASAGPAAATGGTSARAKSTDAAGDTHHCVGNKQFALAGFSAAPPCQPTWNGSNGGATATGVSATAIQVVYYQPEQSLALKAILGPAGLAPSVAQIDDYLARATTFINTRYQLWHRQIHFIDFVSQSCEASPPNDACFRQDAQTIVARYHPFAVVFPRNLTAPGFQQQLSQLGVVNFGGAGLPASFDTSQAPYHYDYDMDGDTQAVLTGEWYCKELANQPARYAGDPSLQSKPRNAEVLVDDTPGFVESAQHLASIINACDKNGAVVKTFSPDTSQAVLETTTIASQAKQSGITTLLYFTDPILPVYLTPQLSDQSYYPENVVVGSGYIDFDPLAQLYDTKQWAHAFGPGDLPDPEPLLAYDVGAVYRVTTGSQAPFLSAAIMQSFFSALAAGLQEAGPDLTPATFQRAMLSLPPWGNTKYQPLIQFGPGDYTAVSNARVEFWNPSATSAVNGKAGSYTSLYGGQRFAQGQFPSTPFVEPGA